MSRAAKPAATALAEVELNGADVTITRSAHSDATGEIDDVKAAGIHAARFGDAGIARTDIADDDAGIDGAGIEGAGVAARAAEAGVATVWAAAAVAVLTTVVAACLHLGAALLARHRAESAADLAALAAAREAVRGEVGACQRAAEIATAMGAEVARCRLVGWNALVEVQVAVPLAVVLSLIHI